MPPRRHAGDHGELFIDGARRRSRWRRAAALLATAEATPDIADQVAVRDAMLTALQALPPRQRACVVLRYYEDLPVASVAAALGVAEGTVKRYLSEAMTMLAAGLPLRGQSAAEGDQADADR